VITAVHTLVYADDPEAARAFFRDVLGWEWVDAHDGWLIFKTGPSELGVHPIGEGPMQHQVSLVCDDIEATVADLAAKGTAFESGIEDRGFGRGIDLRIPGAGTMVLYEPRHPTAFDL
jgi:catechol 2,3-dioxygenase-like lactoylglutathione lyase family enzyme